MKKVSILSLHLGFGGIEKSICSLANMLCGKYEVEIACCYKLYDKSSFKLDDRVKIIYLNDDNIVPNKDEFKLAVKKFNILKIIKEGLFSIKVLNLRKKKMIEYIKNCDSDVVISTRDIFNTWLSKYGNSSVYRIGWEHNHFHDDYGYARKIVKSVKNLDSFVLVSLNLKDYYSEELRNKKVNCFYIPNSIDEIPINASKLSDKRFISVGRLCNEKGYLDLLKIMTEIRKKYPDWKLDIIGDGDQKDILVKYINDNNLNNYVKLHGFKDKDYINDLFSKSSIYLMSSYTESFGIVLIEAMSYGIPCIAFSSAEGACEIIDNNKNGFLVDNRDFDLMIEKISLLVDDSKKRKEMGNCARDSVLKYTSDIISKEWINLIEKSGIDE